jgi:radical SAM protein with 4Fe4S-binding SPASM domain
VEQTNKGPDPKRYLIRREPFFGILYDRWQKKYSTIPSSEVESWQNRADVDWIDYRSLVKDNPRTAFGAPVTLFLDITSRCQCRCWFCYNRSGEEHPSEMNSEVVCSLIRRFGGLGGMELRLSGGEPTLHPDLPLFIDLAGRYALRTILVSNGMIAPRMLEYLKYSPVTAYYLSLQGDRNTHDAVRGEGSYDQCCHTAATLIAAGCRVRLSMIFHKRNQHSLEHIVNLADRLGAELAFNPLRPFGRADIADMLEPDEHRRLVEKVLELQRRFPYLKIETPWSYLLFPPMKPTPSVEITRRLGCGGNALSIAVNGDCFGCGQLSALPEFCLGNIHQDDLLMIWSRSRAACRLANAPLSAKCNDCAYLAGSPCFGGCMATALAVRGSLSAGDPYCFIDLLEKESLA